jgi:hypothetical protein
VSNRERRLCLLNANSGKFSIMFSANTVSGHMVNREKRPFAALTPQYMCMMYERSYRIILKRESLLGRPLLR